jgi:site-specific DNA-methyltransferase (adenine-specific)
VGSASSLIACYNLGFEYVGFELDKEYFDKATQRIENRKNQLDIFHIGDLDE